jgi:hypothetical protein
VYTELFFIISISCLIVISILIALQLWWQINTNYILLEIIPSSKVKQTLLATEQFLKSLYSLGKQQSWIYRFIGIKKCFSLEVISTKEQGIRFLIRVNQIDAGIVKKHIHSFLSGARITESTDYLPKESTGFWSTVTFTLSRHYFHSLQEQAPLDQHDSISYITGQMTKLTKDEAIALHFILTPALYNEKNSFLSLVFHNVLMLIAFLILSPITLLSWLLSNDRGQEPLPFWLFNTKKKEQNQELHNKIDRELFTTSIRLYVKQKTQKQLVERINGLASAFAGFRNGNQQELKIKRVVPFLEKFQLVKKVYFFQLKHRLFSATDNPILSVKEVAGLFHFPVNEDKTEDIVETLTKQLPAPLSLKRNDKIFDNIFANNVYTDTVTPIGLTEEERRRHMYIIGATGTGKTTFLATMIINDIQNGKGVCVIDPHGNLIQECLVNVPEERINDVIYFNPLDKAYPIGINLLEMKKGLTEEQIEDEKDIITSSIISIFHKLYSDKYLGPRMEHILRFAILTALEDEKPTLFTIQKLLIDEKYRARLVAKLKDPVVKDFWLHEFKQFGSYQKAEAVSPITNKLGRFLSSPLCRNILGQAHTTIDFERIMNEGKILLCNLPKGRLGEDNSTFFGVLITAKLQLAALQREKLNEKKRKDFYLYIDEFQNFATSAFAQIMSEARKYRLNAILAHQTIAQIEDHDLVKIILANTGTILCFRTASPLDEEYLLPYFAPQIEKGEIANLPSFHFYIKNNALTPQKTFLGETIQFTRKQDSEITTKIIAYSQKVYGVPREQVKKEIDVFYNQQPSSLKKTKSSKAETIVKQATMV